MSVIRLPPPARPRRPIFDIERVRAWYEALPDDPDAPAPNRFTVWGLRDLSRATRIPQSALRTVLWQLLWRPERPSAGVEIWHPPQWVQPVRPEERKLIQ